MNLKQVILIIFIIQTSLLSEVRYVSKTGGTPAPPYTSWVTACDSIQKCLDYCSNGDTVYIDRGIYKETLYTLNKTITIIGVDTDECIIDGTGINGYMDNTELVHFKQSDVTVKNLTFKKKQINSNNFNVAVYLEKGKMSIENCNIDSVGYGVATTQDTEVKDLVFRDVTKGLYILTYEDYYKFTIENCYFNLVLLNNLGCFGITNTIGGGEYEIRNNIITSNVEWHQSYYGINISTNNKAVITNNLISGFRNSINALATGDGSTDTSFVINNTMIAPAHCGIATGNNGKYFVIKNNIVVRSNRGVYSYGSPGYSDNNLYFDLSKAMYYSMTAGMNDRIADPMFVNDTVPLVGNLYDYRLQKYSPGIDAGDPNILDVDGTRSDIGVYGGPYGISYEYKDLPPKQIKKITAKYKLDSSKIELVWEKRWESDFKEYRLYKGIISNFTISPKYLIATLNDSVYTDYLTKGSQELYYKVTAVDSTGNESIPSTEVNVTITDVNEVDIKLNYNYELYQNYPNPFNPNTTIGYSLKESGDVRVKLYDVTGKLLQTIIEGEKDKGYNETKIDLSNYASGIYLYRLEVTGKGKIPVFNDLKKMVYVK